MKKPLIVIAGPTAVGKTKIAINLAKKINTEIISADSMQIYKYMNIGTAKPSTQEMMGIKHHLIDELLPNDEYSVAIFKEKAEKYISSIHEKNKIPIIAGGTGFYINSLVKGNDFTVAENNYSYREEFYNKATEQGNDYLHNLLREVDFEAAEKIHPNNVKRVVRALEYFKTTGEKISIHNEREKQRESNYDVSFIILNSSRETLYSRIDKRVDLMFEQGLVDEVENLLKMGYNENLVSMQGLGYKEIVKYIKGECNLEDSKYILKRDTRHFAKRQLTWFKNQNDGFWINIEDFENMELILNYILRKV